MVVRTVRPSNLIMLWVKAFHVIFVVCWFAGLFYLPRLYVYHATEQNISTIARFKIMEWRLFWYITTPAAILVGLLGWTMIFSNYSYYEHLNWLHLKLILALFLYIFHLYLGKLLWDFYRDKNKHSARFYRYLNEVPTLFLIAIVILTIVKPI